MTADVLPENDLRSLGKGRGGSAPAVAPVASSSAGHPAAELEARDTGTICEELTG